jgi:hypothetical protein
LHWRPGLDILAVDWSAPLHKEDSMTREERKAAQRELAEAKNRADEFKAPKFETEVEANAALSSVAKVLNMKKREEKPTMSKRAKNIIDGLNALPPLPKAPAKPKPDRPCACGCGSTTKRTWAPGHDSNFRGWVMRIERKLLTYDDIPHEGVREAVKREVVRRKNAEKSNVG